MYKWILFIFVMTWPSLVLATYFIEGNIDSFLMGFSCCGWIINLLALLDEYKKGVR